MPDTNEHLYETLSHAPLGCEPLANNLREDEAATMLAELTGGARKIYKVTDHRNPERFEIWHRVHSAFPPADMVRDD